MTSFELGYIIPYIIKNMKMTKDSRHNPGPLTKEDIKYVIENWGKIIPGEMASYLGRRNSAISYIAKAVRETGYDLPKLNKKAMLKTIIDEALVELGLKKGE